MNDVHTVLLSVAIIHYSIDHIAFTTEYTLSTTTVILI